jgi:hypothetical protein
MSTVTDRLSAALADRYRVEREVIVVGDVLRYLRERLKN